MLNCTANGYTHSLMKKFKIIRFPSNLIQWSIWIMQKNWIPKRNETLDKVSFIFKIV
jgi:hypothetical protein